ncbi:MAG: RAD55 family ATPase, partial [Promethearchaeota archaeon]
MNRKNIVLEPRISIPPEIIAAFDRDDIGYNLLVKGTAGCGKTTFAMSLLSYFTQFTPVYLSTRVAPSSIYSQFPWLKDRLKAENIIDATRTYLPPTNDIDSNNMKNHLKQTIRFQSVEEFLEIMYKKVKQYERPILVIDSWDAIFGREDDLNINVENLFTEFIRQTNAKLILISESELNDNFLEYIVDGVITLKDDEIEGRPFRILQINKIRAVVRHQKAYAFTVYKNRFQYNFPYMPHRLEEISQF